MYCDLWPYVWLVFKSGFKSRAGYSGARTVHGLWLNQRDYREESQTKCGEHRGVFRMLILWVLSVNKIFIWHPIFFLQC